MLAWISQNMLRGHMLDSVGYRFGIFDCILTISILVRIPATTSGCNAS